MPILPILLAAPIVLAASPQPARTPPAKPIDMPTRWSIQVDPYADAPYAAARPCPTQAGPDVVVCARPNIEERLPLPAERGPPAGPRRVVKYLDGAEGPHGPACGATQSGCTVGIGPTPTMIAGAVGLVKGAFAKKPDRSGRVPIPLDDPSSAKP